MVSDAYRYPDVGDRVTGHLIHQHEPFDGYWDSSEQVALAHALLEIRVRLGNNPLRVLDAGCGEGRLIPWVASFAERVTAIDPDVTRLGVASRVALPAGAPRVTTKVGTIEDEAPGDFDLVICSHILQHVATKQLAPIIASLRRQVRQGGLLLLMYTRASAAEHFTMERLNCAAVTSVELTAAQYDDCVLNGARSPGLPVHHIDQAALESMAAGTGWAPRWNWRYHVVNAPTQVTSADRVGDTLAIDVAANSARCSGQQTARDVMAVWEAIAHGA